MSAAQRTGRSKAASQSKQATTHTASKKGPAHKRPPAAPTAFRIHGEVNGAWRAGLGPVTPGEPGDGEVLIAVEWSSVNYKDALAGTGRARIVRRFPLTGGIDAAGTILQSNSPDFAVGDPVLVTGCGHSETRDGGYAPQLIAATDSVVALPDGLDLRQAMAIGTAGFTAALALLRMERAGQRPEHGPIVVTGASGGVGSLAIDILTGAGYEAHAITGRIEHLDFLTRLGARQVISREALYWGQRPLEKALWAGAMDAVGGEMLEGLTRVIAPGGNIASYGMAGGVELHTTVMPFILRAVSLLGISASNAPREDRDAVWERLAGAWRPRHLELITQREIGLDELPETFEQMLTGQLLGRTVVRIARNGPTRAG